MKRYADFFYYVGEYNGNKITDEHIFNDCAEVLSRYIDSVTFNRLKAFSEDEISYDIKICLCRLADEYVSHKNRYNDESGNIKSETAGKVSVTYTETTRDVISAYQSNLYNICRMYISEHMSGKINGKVAY